ncbi:MAG: hypothetical protein LIO79_07820, partial [Rikenellaceae bacterium]|nr:hypothetical protein [Rikenellaceae bacterium]
MKIIKKGGVFSLRLTSKFCNVTVLVVFLQYHNSRCEVPPLFIISNKKKEEALLWFPFFCFIFTIEIINNNNMDKVKILTGPSASCYQGNCFESFYMSWNDITQEVAIPEATDRIFLKLPACFYRYTTYFTISHTRAADCSSIVLPLSKPVTPFKTYRLIFNHPRSLFGLSSPVWRSYCINWVRAIFRNHSWNKKKKRTPKTMELKPVAFLQ